MLRGLGVWALGVSGLGFRGLRSGSNVHWGWGLSN